MCHSALAVTIIIDMILNAKQQLNGHSNVVCNLLLVLLIKQGSNEISSYETINVICNGNCGNLHTTTKSSPRIIHCHVHIYLSV